MAFIGLKSWCLQDCVPSGGCRGESFPCLFLLLEALCTPEFVAQHPPTSVSIFTSSLTLILLPPPIKTPVIILGSPRYPKIVSPSQDP